MKRDEDIVLLLLALADKVLQVIDNPEEIQRDFRGSVLLEEQELVPMVSRRNFIASSITAALVEAYAMGGNIDTKTTQAMHEFTAFFMAEVASKDKDLFPTTQKYLYEKEGSHG